MSTQTNHYGYCPNCGKKGIYMDKDNGRPICKYCGKLTQWSEVKYRK